MRIEDIHHLVHVHETQSHWRASIWGEAIGQGQQLRLLNVTIICEKQTGKQTPIYHTHADIGVWANGVSHAASIFRILSLPDFGDVLNPLHSSGIKVWAELLHVQTPLITPTVHNSVLTKTATLCVTSLRWKVQALQDLDSLFALCQSLTISYWLAVLHGMSTAEELPGCLSQIVPDPWRQSSLPSEWAGTNLDRSPDCLSSCGSTHGQRSPQCGHSLRLSLSLD